MELDFVRSKVLNNIPARKLQEAISAINNEAIEPSDKMTKLLMINRYADSNLPLEYWTLKMEQDFKGDPRLLQKYNTYIKDLRLAYSAGLSICFAGGHGLGKSFAITSILKKASLKGFSCLYTTLSDVVGALTSGYGDDIKDAKRELVMVDFLAIDEFDQRFISSDNAADLYARSLEIIFRTRSQNKLPTLMATNSPNPIDSFNGSLKMSIDSLMKGYMETFVVMPGNDFRKGSK